MDATTRPRKGSVQKKERDFVVKVQIAELDFSRGRATTHKGGGNKRSRPSLPGVVRSLPGL